MDLSKLPIALLFLITLLCAVVCSNYKALFIRKHVRYNSGLYLLNGGISLFGAVVLLAVGGFNLMLSGYSLWLGIVFGVFTMANAVLGEAAIKTGPFGYSTVIINLSTGITALSGALFWDETLSATKIIGLILMLACFFLAVDTSDSKDKKASIQWFIICIFALITCAGIGLLQKIHQTSEYKDELIQFLFVAFVISFVFSFVIYFLLKRKEKTFLENSDVTVKINLRKILIPLAVVFIVCGVCVALNNVFNLFLSGVVDSSVFFPIVNGVPLLSNLIISFVIFKEKLSVKQIVGLIIGIIAIICLFL